MIWYNVPVLIQFTLITGQGIDKPAYYSSDTFVILADPEMSCKGITRLYLSAKIEKFQSDYCGQKVKINQLINF